MFGSTVFTLLSFIEAFLHDVTAAMLMILHKEKTVMLVSQTNSSRAALYFYANNVL